MQYKPNFKDSRVQMRVKTALGFVRGHFSNNSPQKWSTRYIDEHLGQSQNKLGKWIRNHLLITTNNHYSMDDGICKEYILSEKRYEWMRDCLNQQYLIDFSSYSNRETDRHNMSLRDLVEITDDCEIPKRVSASIDLFTNDTHWTDNRLNDSGVEFLRNYKSKRHHHTVTPSLSPSVLHLSDHELVHRWANEKFLKELTSLDFEYKDQSHRLWHPLQNVKSKYKKIIFAEAGMKHQYDIECCAPTLIHQYAQRCGMDLYLFAIRKYMHDRSAVRKQLARDLDIDVDISKQIINSLFAGARIANNSDTAIYDMLKGDIAKIECLKGHQYVCELRNDIKTCWDYIKPSMMRKSVTTKNNKEKLLPISSREKWNIYFNAERQVIDSVRKYLTENSNKHFLEHDGWCACNEIDAESLVDYIKENTGYTVNIKCEVIEVVDTVTPSLSPSVLHLHN